MIFTTDEDVYGRFFSVAVEQYGELFFDQNMFVLSFESHGRCKTPHVFALKKAWQRRGSLEAIQE